MAGGGWNRGGQRPIGSGRQPGTPNRRQKILQELFDEHHFDPALHILKVLGECEPNEQANICLALLPYLYTRKEPERISVFGILFKHGYQNLDELPDDILEREIGNIVLSSRPKNIGSGSPSTDDTSGTKTEEKEITKSNKVQDK